MRLNLRLLKVFMILIAFLWGNFSFAQQKVLTEKAKNLIEKGQIKMPEASVKAKTFTKAPTNSVSLNRLVKNKYRGTAYAVNALNNSVVSFDLTSPGTLNTISTLTLSGTNFICAGSWADNTWYVSEYGANTLGTIDPSDGTYTVIGSFGVGINALAYDNSTNTMYGAGTDNTNSQLYTINLSTGAATLVGSAGAGVIIGMACNASGTLFAANLDDNLYTIDKTTGASTLVGPLGVSINYSQDLEYDNENDILYLAGYTTLASLYTVDPATGAATLVGDFPSSTEMCGLAIPYNPVTYTNDVALQSIMSPVTGPNLTATEPVIVRVKNNGTVSQSNIAVSYTLNGGTAVNEVIAGPIAAGAYVDYTFTQTADLSAVQGYEIVATATLTGDENPNNNSKTKNVTNLGNLVLMQNGTVTTCSGSFYDTGGPDGTYQINEDITMTIAPSTPGAKMKFNFTAFDCENNWDFLKVYDGADVNAPMIGNFTGASIPAELVELIASQTNTSGAITFHFTSDNSVMHLGWAATMSCVVSANLDLAGVSVSGNAAPVINTAETYTVTVANSGAQAVTGANYTVNLYDAANTVIGTANGVDIAAGESKTFDFSWTPTALGATHLYGKVVLTGDENPANDQTPNFNVNVIQGGSNPVIYSSDFESFTAGGQVACQDPTNWTTWSNAPCSPTEDAFISTDFAQSGVNSIKDEGVNDLVLNMGNKTTGKYEYTFSMYVPSNFCGYYNVLQDFAGGSSKWGLEVYFHTDGTGLVNAGANNATTFTYVHDQWIPIKNVIDLDNDLAELIINGVSIYSWQWSLGATGTGGVNQLSASDFFAGADANFTTDVPKYYLDDISYKEYVPVNPPIYANDFESFTAGGQVACQDPTNWTTWSNAPCGTEDAYVSTDFAHGGVNAVKDELANDLVLNFGNKTTGKYQFSFWMYLPANHGGYYNLLHNFAGSTSEWGLECYFQDAGTLNIQTGADTITTPYNHDQWFKMTNVIDLDNDQASVYMDDNLLTTWQWSLNELNGNPGLNQLSATDFFSGTGATGITNPLYYFDDIEFTALSAPAGPHIAVTPTSLSQDLAPNATATQTLNIANTGSGDLNFTIDVAYPVKSVKIVNHNTKYERVIEKIPAKGGKILVDNQTSRALPEVVDYATITKSTTNVNKHIAKFGRATILYDQTANLSAEGGISSQVFPDSPTYSNQGADDFIVPSGSTWTVGHVYVAGSYSSGALGEVPAVDVIFYNDAAGVPGTAVATFTAIPAISDATGNVNVFLTSPVTLTAGHYWVSVAANMAYGTYGQWYWSKQAAPTIQNEFEWQNPGGGFAGCTSWCPSSTQWPTQLDKNLTFALSDSVNTPPTYNWLAANPISGTVAGGNSVDVQVTFDANGLALGTYNGNLAINSNDAAHATVNVPATLNVAIAGGLPLIEDWASGSFATNDWTFDPAQSNWSVSTSTGNPAPSAQFGWSPQITNYNFALVSEALDATSITDNVTLKFDINLNNFATTTLEGMAVEVFDGSAWQMVHDYQNTNGSIAWTSDAYNITSLAAGHSFKVRFRAYGADSYNINYWYVDNIKIYQQVVGNIAGTVTKLSDNTPVAGAAITMTNALSGTYTATTAADGTYAINGAEAGNYALTLSKEGYNVISGNVAITGNQTLTQNYQLTAPTIAVAPNSLTVTVPVGQTTTRDLTITNSGNGPLAWSGNLQSNKDQISIPASNGNFEHTAASAGVAPVVNKTNVANTYKGVRGSTAYGFDVNNGIFMSINTDDPSNATTIANVTVTPFGGTFDASNTDFMYIIDYNDGAIKKVEVATGNVTTVGAAGLQSGDTPTGLTCDKSAGIFYAASTNGTESLLYTIDPATGASTVVGPTGIPALIDITIDGTGQMYGYDIVADNAYKIDKTSGTSTLIGSIGFNSSYAQGMCWDPASDAIYMAAYNAGTSAGELRLFDKVTGNTAVLGSLPGEIDGFAFPGGGGGNWASIAPNSGVIAPGATATVTVTFDGNYIPPQKDLTVTGNMVFASDPNVGSPSVALSMTISGEFTGILNGTVNHGTTPVEGVTVTATREESPVYTYSMVTGADGAYSFNPAMYGTYDITATKEGFNPYSTTGVTVAGGQTTTHAIAMVAPIMVIDPLSITATAPFGQIITQTIHVTNNGDGSLEWTGKAIPNNKLQVSIPASNGNFEHTSASAGVAPTVNKTNVASAYKGAKGSIAYGFDVNNGIFMSFDMDDPSNATTIANVTITPFGGTFDASNTDFMYVIDYNDGAIKKVDVATGEATTVGAAGLQSGDTPTGLTCDKTDGTMYAASTNGTESLLYTIDPATGASTVVGPTGIPALIDIAIDGEGQMYGYDIVGDNAYKIDKTNGTSTMIGSIGFNASYAQGMGWDPASDVIYMAAYNAGTSAGELRLFDKLTGNTAVIGSLPGEIDGFAFPGGGSNWLSIDPKTGIIPAGASQDVIVTLDGNYIPPQKDYTLTGSILFTSDPNVATTSVPVTFTVQGEIYGILTGTVTHNGANVPNVTVTASKSGTTYTATSGADGVYTFPQVLGGTYDVTAEAMGYNSFSTTGIVITGGQTATLPIVLNAPVMVVNPASLTVNILPGATTDQTIAVNNTGDGSLTWTAAVQANSKRQVSIPASNGNFAHTPATLGVAPAAKNTNVITGGTTKGAKGSVAYGFDVNNGAFMSFDMDNPSSPTTIASVTVTPFGGTFDGTHTDFMYIIDYNDGAIKTIDVATGNVTTVGPAGLASGNTPTGLTCDKSTGILYATCTNGSESLIYTVDPSTGAATLIGPTGIPALIDFAIDGTGQMYGYDIVGDNAYTIDKTTGTSTLLGSIGFDANYAQGMAWDPATDAIYLAAYSTAGELRLFDKTTGNSAMIGSLPSEIDGFAFPGGGTTPWITIAPKTGIVPAGNSQNVTVHFDATELTEGDYTATITFASDPNVGTVNVPVTLHVGNVGPQTTLTIANVTAETGSAVSVPVHALLVNNMGSFQFTVEYDPTLMTYTGTSNWYTGIDAVTVGNPAAGKLTFVWAAETEGINIPDGNFFNMDFTWNGAAGQTSPLTWSDNPTPREFGDYNGVIFTPTYVNGSVTTGGPVPTVTIGSVQTLVSGPFVVPVNAKNITNMGSFQFTIEYDPTIIEYTSVDNWYTGIEAVTTGNPSAGHITFVWAADLNGINIPDNNFFNINFNWIASDVMSTDVIWSDVPTPREFADYDGNIFVPVYENGSETGPHGIPEIGSASNSVSPNPASNFVKIEASNDIRTVQVMNNLGMVISSANLAQEKTVNLNTSNFSAGTYFVRFISENGKTTVKKLVIIK